MGARSRIKIFLSIILVVMISGALILWFDEMRSVIASDSAEINADSYSVGVDSSGLMTQQYVEAGDRVEEGQTLFQIKSPSLLEELRKKNLNQEDLLYPLNDDGEILVKASRSGLVAELNYKKGSFVPANEKIATIINQSALEVVATYELARRDYNLLSMDTIVNVRLPSGQWTSGRAKNIEVTEQKDQTVVVEVTADIANKSSTADFSSTTGVPVEAKVRLRDDTLFNQLSDIVRRTYNGIRH